LRAFSSVAALLLLAGCSGGAADNTDDGQAPAPVDGVGVFSGSMSYRFAPENSGFSGGGTLISDGSTALGGWRSSSQGLVIEYKFTRSGDATSGALVLRRAWSAQRCTGNGTGALVNNTSYTIDAFVLSNVATGNECRGGASGTYDAAKSEYPARSISDLAGSYASTNSVAGGGGFDVGGSRFTLTIGAVGTIQLNGQCSGTIALVSARKGVARVTGIGASCGDASGAPIEGLVAFDGADLLVYLVQPDNYRHWSGTLQRQ
jgi:hypothetical protein